VCVLVFRKVTDSYTVILNTGIIHITESSHDTDDPPTSETIQRHGGDFLRVTTLLVNIITMIYLH